MTLHSIILIALSLSMDAFAVAIANGTLIKQNKLKKAFILAFYFGLFQMAMPIIGWILGEYIKGFFDMFKNWVAFCILLGIGSKMIYESKKMKGAAKNNLDFYTILMLAIATSIDALAVGISFSCLNTSFLFASIIIGIITFIMSYIGVLIGNKCGHVFEDKIEMTGGIILIALGVKLLLGSII